MVGVTKYFHLNLQTIVFGMILKINTESKCVDGFVTNARAESREKIKNE